MLRGTFAASFVLFQFHQFEARKSEGLSLIDVKSKTHLVYHTQLVALSFLGRELDLKCC